jgi:hypothetical protein
VPAFWDSFAPSLGVSPYYLNTPKPLLAIRSLRKSGVAIRPKLGVTDGVSPRPPLVIEGAACPKLLVSRMQMDVYSFISPY